MIKKGFTLVEVLASLVIIGVIISATAVTYNKVWQNNQIDICENDLRDISSSFSSYMIDYGNIVIANDINYETVLEEIVDTLNKQYLSSEIKVDEIASDMKSVKLTTKTKADPWKGKYQINIYTYSGDDKDSIPGLIIITSSGVNGLSSRVTYTDGIYGDDIMAILEPK